MSPISSDEHRPSTRQLEPAAAIGTRPGRHPSRAEQLRLDELFRMPRSELDALTCDQAQGMDRLPPSALPVSFSP